MRRLGPAGLLPLGVWAGCMFGSSGGGGAQLGESTTGDEVASTGAVASTAPGTDTTAASGDSADTTTGVPAGSSSSGETDPTEASSTGAGIACGQDNGGCDLNATCDDAGDEIICTCNRGWAGDGSTCASSGSLPTLRFEVPCVGSQVGCSNSDGFCLTGSLEETAMAVMEGDPGVVYNVTISLRGVVAEKSYLGGVTDAYWNEGGTPGLDTWAVARIDVSDPLQSFFLNAGTSGSPFCDRLDYDRVVPIATGATVTIGYYDTNLCAAHNEDAFGMPITFDDVEPIGLPFDGQFLQVDTVSSTPQQ
jgi:hypothetical protein